MPLKVKQLAPPFLLAELKYNDMRWKSHVRLWDWSHILRMHLNCGEDIRGLRSVIQSCPTLCNPIDCSPAGSSVHGISQARILEWAAISYSRDLSDPGFEPASFALSGGFFTTVLPGKPRRLCIVLRLIRLYTLSMWGFVHQLNPSKAVKEIIKLRASR